MLITHLCLQVDDYNSTITACFTLFRTILGDFNFVAIERADPLFGPFYFLSYIFFVFFVLLNMFLAIINDTYSEVKAEIFTQKNDFEEDLKDFFTKGCEIYKGYVDDPRNTDNSWMETVAFNFHDPSGQEVRTKKKLTFPFFIFLKTFRLVSCLCKLVMMQEQSSGCLLMQRWLSSS